MALDEAGGCFGAHDVVSHCDVPPFANSAMDGFAVISADVAAATPESPVRLAVTGQSAAGRPCPEIVRSGEAIEIMTGAVVPDGADTIVRIEDTRPGGGCVAINAPAPLGQYIRPAGRDTRRDSVICTAGTLLTPARIGVLASCGIGQIAVFARPGVTLLTGGDELVPPGSPLKPGQIYDANGPMLQARLRSLGYEVKSTTHATDSPAALAEAFTRALAHSDVIISIGGVSMGAHDHVRDAAASVGFRQVFWRVNQQPGGPMFFATRDDSVLFGLPGNPVSAYVCLDLYVLPFLRKASGCRAPQPESLCVRTTEDLFKKHDKTAFIRARLKQTGTELQAQSTGPQDSNLLSSLVDAGGYIVFPENQRHLPSGSEATFLLAPGTH